MKKTLIPVLTCVIAIGCAGCLGPHLKKPHSEVPVVYRIGHWFYQPGLTVTNFTVEVVDAPLNVFNDKALVRMQISGTLRAREMMTDYLFCRPCITKVHISERFAPRMTNAVPVADFLVTPVVGTSDTKVAMGKDQVVPFHVKAEMYFQTFDWGQNQYVIRCESFQTNITLHQMK